MPSDPQQKPIVYGMSEINGIPVRPSSRDILAKAVKGAVIQVSSGNDYINLYHVFERMQQRDKKLRGLVLVRKQIDTSTWWLFVTDDRKDVPEVELNDGYDPKRGRYKRYAQELSEGNALTFADRTEAIKAVRAWRLYVPKKARPGVRAAVRRVARSGKFLVSVVEKDV